MQVSVRRHSTFDLFPCTAVPPPEHPALPPATEGQEYDPPRLNHFRNKKPDSSLARSSRRPHALSCPQSPKAKSTPPPLRASPQPIRSLSEGYHESRRCSRDTYPESYITKYTSIRRKKTDSSRAPRSHHPHNMPLPRSPTANSTGVPRS